MPVFLAYFTLTDSQSYYISLSLPLGCAFQFYLIGLCHQVATPCKQQKTPKKPTYILASNINIYVENSV